MTRPSVALAVPMYNEAAGVDAFVQAVQAMCEGMPEIDFRIICIDDGSSDETLVQLLAAVQRDPRFSVIELSRNFGKEAALSAGLAAAAQSDAVIPFDADLQDPPEVIPQLIRAWQAGAEVVLARRSDRSSDGFLKRKTAEWFYAVHNRLSPVRIPPNVGDFRLLDRRVVAVLLQLPERQRFMKGLFAWAGFKTATIDYVRTPRRAGSGKFSGSKLWGLALEGITGFSTAPLKIWSYLGSGIAALSLLYALGMVLKVLWYGRDVPGYASLIVTICFFSGLQMIGIGILGEYLGRVYMESKQRPLYVIRQVHGRFSLS